MKLPGNKVGVTDVIQRRECPRRYEFGMQRWEEGEAPEATNPSNAYGSAIHDVIHAIDNGASDEVAIQEAFDKYGAWFEPDDLARLEKDIETYHQRDYLGVKTIVSEEEFSIPLMEWDCPGCEGCDNCDEGTVTIYYRFKVDRLYQRLDDPTAFIHIDYKSSKWPRTQKEVDEDVQLWIYNWALFEVFPEIEKLEQVYDQLMYGPLYTRKSAEKRVLAKKWLQKQVAAILRDERKEEDGLAVAKFNKWCAYCAILSSCPVIPRLSKFAQTKIAIEREAVEGLDSPDSLNADDFARFVDLLDTAGDGEKALKAYSELVKGVLRQLPAETREELGYKLSPRSKTSWDAEAKRSALDLLGEPFFDLVSLAKKRLEEADLPDDTKAAVMSLASKRLGSEVLTKKR